MGLGTALADLPLAQKRALAALILVGGSVGSRQIAKEVRAAQREQAALVAQLEGQTTRLGAPRKPKVAVDALFAERLTRILRICVPGLWTPEAALIGVQGCLLVWRTWLTDYISRIEARAGRHLIAQEFPMFARLLAGFAGVAIPAAVVNAGLKYCQKLIQLAFMRRLTHHLHQHYCSHRAYYAASTLGGLTNADQRITEDVEKFAFAIADLYSYTFKPLLDVMLFTRSLSRIMGYRGQAALYAYYLVTALGLRTMSPPLALMTAQEASLTGALRAAHQRLVTYSEEVAFNDPPAGGAERLILNQHLRRLLTHTKLSAFQRFVQGCCDQYFVKYAATVVAMLVYAAPLWLRDAGTRGNRDDLTQDYIRAMRLLQNTSRGVGDLILVYKRVTALAGHTSRVAELLEQVKKLSWEDGGLYHRQLYMRNVGSTTALTVQDGKVDGDLPPPSRVLGDIIRFNRLALYAPDGTVLVKELTFDVPPGRSVIIMGPNGSGKSSLFRVLAGLWPLQGGEVTLPEKRALFYLSQRPYLVAGSLRDQLQYPSPPTAVWAEAPPAAKARFRRLEGPGAGEGFDSVDPEQQEARMSACLDAVDLGYLLNRGNQGWDQVQNWQETLSGGEKQRLAMARLLFHNPRYAVLDECTSAVAADGEVQLYQAALAAGITLLSIGHRPALRNFHSVAVHFDGHQTENGWHLEELTPQSNQQEPYDAVEAADASADA